RRELPLRRHFQIVAVADRLDQPALLRLARNHNRPRIATRQDRGSRVEPEPPLVLLRTMALEATAGEEGSDLLFEELRLGRGRLGAGSPQRRTRSQDDDPEDQNGVPHAISLRASDSRLPGRLWRSIIVKKYPGRNAVGQPTLRRF